MAGLEDFGFGVKASFDSSQFVAGAGQTEEALKKIVLAVDDAILQEKEKIEGLSKVLGLSFEDTKKALSKSEQLYKQHQRELEKQNKDALKQEKEAERERLNLQKRRSQSIKETTKSVMGLRDMLLSVATISLGGLGLSSIISAGNNLAMANINAKQFAQRTGTDIKDVVAYEEVAKLTPGATAQDAYRGMDAFANEKYLRQVGGQNLENSTLLQLQKETGISYANILDKKNLNEALIEMVKELRSQGKDDQYIAKTVERSGFASGALVNRALRSPEANRKDYDHARALSSDRIKEMAADEALLKREAELKARLDKLARRVLTDLIPLMNKGIDALESLTKWAEKNPDTAKEILEIVAGLYALGAIVKLLSPIFSILKIGFKGVSLATKAMGGVGAVAGGVGATAAVTSGIIATAGAEAVGAGIAARIGYEGSKVLNNARDGDQARRFKEGMSPRLHKNLAELEYNKLHPLERYKYYNRAANHISTNTQNKHVDNHFNFQNMRVSANNPQEFSDSLRDSLSTNGLVALGNAGQL